MRSPGLFTGALITHSQACASKSGRGCALPGLSHTYYFKPTAIAAADERIIDICERRKTAEVKSGVASAGVAASRDSERESWGFLGGFAEKRSVRRPASKHPRANKLAGLVENR